MVVLGFAVVGAASVGGSLTRRVSALVVRQPQPAKPQPVVYRPLAQDDAVLVDVQVSPHGARLMLDGEPLESNPVRLPRDNHPHTLAASARGYAPEVKEFTAEAPKTVRLHLARAR